MLRGDGWPCPSRSVYGTCVERGVHPFAHGLPEAAARRVRLEVEEGIQGEGTVPAVIRVMWGEVHVGFEE